MLPGPYFASVAGVAVLLAMVVPIAENGTAYFPPENEQPTCTQEMYSWRHGGQVLRHLVAVDGGYASWFGAHYRAAGEPSLYLASTGQEPRVEAVRFAWLRSFDAPIFVRVDYRRDGPWLVATKLTGMGGYEPGGVSERMERSLTVGEATVLAGLLERPDIFAHAGGACSETGPDGTQWILERQSRGRYELANYWWPGTSPGEPGTDVRLIGLYLMGLTGWDLEPNY